MVKPCNQGSWCVYRGEQQLPPYFGTKEEADKLDAVEIHPDILALLATGDALCQKSVVTAEELIILQLYERAITQLLIAAGLEP